MKTEALTLKYNYKVDNSIRKQRCLAWIKYAQTKSVFPHNLKAEIDDNGILHYHGKVSYPDKWSHIDFNKEVKMDGIHAYTKPLFDEVGWADYSTKGIAVKAAAAEAVPVPWIGTPEQRNAEAAATIKLLKPIKTSDIDFGWGV